LPSYNILAADRLRDCGQWLYMAGHKVNPSIKSEANMAICSCVMSSGTSTLNMTLIT